MITHPAGSHCVNCGREVQFSSDGYSACCQDRVCDGGSGFGLDRWTIGTLTYDPATGRDVRTVTGTLTACCSAMADRKAADQAPGRIALCRAH